MSNWNNAYIDAFFAEQESYKLSPTDISTRWIDQKCTPDVISIIADCILQYVQSPEGTIVFSSSDIWKSDYALEYVPQIFKKPDLNNLSSAHEYDKFFSQPLLLLAFSGVLKLEKRGKRNFYRVVDKGILEIISLGERQSLQFLKRYIEKFLTDVGIIDVFNGFLQEQTQESYMKMKTVFTNFLLENSKIRNKWECYRIFTKVINPLAYSANKCGSEAGRISRHKITYDMLMYNRFNFRDTYSDKPKELTRKEHSAENYLKQKEAYIIYATKRAMDYVRKTNILINHGKSENRFGNDPEDAIHIHHIFKKSEFPEISSFIENLIAITPNEHMIYAHPNGNTHLIDPIFQKQLLLSKAETIKSSIEDGWGEYTFSNFVYVLSTGFRNNNIFKNVANNDFNELILIINSF
ncbi:hypothetical protein ACNQ13_00390 [Mycoplasma sp. VS428]|uniref:hypothetical protein n=1 Tax=Mycoplasma sp. VS428 TaxID=3401684 RepID=UPI003AAB665E